MPRRKTKENNNRGKQPSNSQFKLYDIEAITESQVKAFEAYDEGKHLMLHGFAGTGKSFIALYLGLSDMEDKVDGVKKVVIVRSVVPTRDMGFLPGNSKEKSRVYEAPYYSIANELYGRGDAYDILKGKNQIEFITTSFIRGITLDNCVVIVDEAQNMGDMELHSIMTRIGQNTKIIFCGDTRQDDLTSERFHEESGLSKFSKIIREMPQFEFVEFTVDDIVRSDIVKDYIITRDRLGLDWHA
jgi:phosphate starvation-inducible protein PhoH